MPAARKPLALTMGDPAGISGEITVRAWHAPDSKLVPPFVVIGDAQWLRSEAQRLRTHTHIIEVTSCDEALKRFSDGIPVLHSPLAEKPVPGKPAAANAAGVIAAIDRAVSLVRDGAASGVVTNPIHKATLYNAGFSFPGHTEYLAALSGCPHPVMMLSIEGLRVVPVTVHIPLSEVSRSLTRDAIETTVKALNAALQNDFGIAKPRLALAALNPHAGEAGKMGSEETSVIAPAAEALRALGVQIAGPLPADTLFHAESRARYDAVVCMYHDQALIPLKTLDFHHGVNTTLGLPFVRTSPDHGTAFDIAGKGLANPSSLLSALRLADQMSRTRARIS